MICFLSYTFVFTQTYFTLNKTKTIFSICNCVCDQQAFQVLDLIIARYCETTWPTHIIILQLLFSQALYFSEADIMHPSRILQVKWTFVSGCSPSLFSLFSCLLSADVLSPGAPLTLFRAAIFRAELHASITLSACRSSRRQRETESVCPCSVSVCVCVWLFVPLCEYLDNLHIPS